MIGLAVILAAAIIIFGLIYFISRRTSRINHAFFEEKWNNVQKLSSIQSGWVQAIIEADKLVDEALKVHKFKGKNMGERLVSANRLFRDPDSIWRAHKVRNKVVHETNVELNKGIVSSTIKGFRKALKDLGAL